MFETVHYQGFPMPCGSGGMTADLTSTACANVKELSFGLYALTQLGYVPFLSECPSSVKVLKLSVSEGSLGDDEGVLDVLARCLFEKNRLSRESRVHRVELYLKVITSSTDIKNMKGRVNEVADRPQTGLKGVDVKEEFVLRD